jgi:hypothetical protein
VQVCELARAIDSDSGAEGMALVVGHSTALLYTERAPG